MQYQEMVLEATEFSREQIDKVWTGQFRVRVLNSPQGEMTTEQTTAVTYPLGELKEQLDKLENRGFTPKELITLGRTLATLMLPPEEVEPGISVRGLFADSLKEAISQKEGLRIKLRIPKELAIIPWEYMYLDRPGGGDGMDGFLTLDPQVSLVRHEVLLDKSPPTVTTGDVKVLAALAENPDMPPLNLEEEQALLQKALTDQPGIEPIYLDNATLDEILAAAPTTSIFHFAGHGAFDRKMSDFAGTYSGTGVLALSDQMIDAEQLGINLRGNGILLAVLGGCETGRRDGISVWSGIAPALVKVGIPAVVANQYSILDKCAIAFSKHFYLALVGGMSIERAVTAGRLAAFNADKTGRDWGVPVLYLRADNSHLFTGASDKNVRDNAHAATEENISVWVQTENIDQQVGTVKEGGVVAGTIKSVGGTTIIGGKHERSSRAAASEGATALAGEFHAPIIINELKEIEAPIPFQIPQPDPNYIRRERHDELINLLSKENGEIGITLLHGLSGVGKTTMAIAVINELKEEECFPHGILWGDFNTFGNIAGLVEFFLNSLDSKWMSSTEKQESVLRELFWQNFKDKQVFIVLDNITHVEQLNEFLPQEATSFPDNVRILVVSIGLLNDSRHPISKKLMLSPFSTSETKTAFEKIAPSMLQDNQDLLNEMAGILENMPNQIVPSLLTLKRDDLNIHTYIRQLRDGKLTLNAADVGYEALFSQLTDIQQELLEFIAITGEGEIDAALLSALSLRPISTVEEAISQIVAVSILRRSGSTKVNAATSLRAFLVQRQKQWPAYRKNAAYHLFARFCLDKVQDLIAGFQSDLPSRTDFSTKATKNLVDIVHKGIISMWPHFLSIFHWAIDTKQWDIVKRFAFLPYNGILLDLDARNYATECEFKMSTLHGLQVSRIGQNGDYHIKHCAWPEKGITVLSRNGTILKAGPDSRFSLWHSSPTFESLELSLQLTACQMHSPFFQDANLVNCDWIACRVSDALFDRVDLVGSRFVACELNRSVWKECDCRNVVLSESNLRFAIFYRTNLRGADLSNVDLTGALFVDVDLRGSNLQGANLTGARAYQVDIKNCNLTNIDWTGFAAQGLILSEEDERLLLPNIENMASRPVPNESLNLNWLLNAEKIPPFNIVNVDATIWQTVDARCVTFDKFIIANMGYLYQLALDCADFSRVVFDDRLTIVDVSLKAAILRNAQFLGSSTFRNANLRAADLQNVTVKGSWIMVNCTLQGALLQDGVFSDIAVWTECDLRLANFSGVKFAKEARFDNCNLQGAIFDSSQFKELTLDNPDLTNASFSYCTFDKVRFTDDLNTQFSLINEVICDSIVFQSDNSGGLFFENDVTCDSIVIQGDNSGGLHFENNVTCDSIVIRGDNSGGVHFENNVACNNFEIRGDNLGEVHFENNVACNNFEIRGGNSGGVHFDGVIYRSLSFAEVRTGSIYFENTISTHEIFTQLTSALDPVDNTSLEGLINKLVQEVSKGHLANDFRMADLVDDIFDIAEEYIEPIVQLFDTSPIKELAGPATRFVVRSLSKRGLARLILQLKQALQHAPEDKAEAAEDVAKTAEALVNLASEKNPNKKMIQITSEGLVQAAQNIANTMPTVLTIATQIVDTIVRETEFIESSSRFVGSRSENIELARLIKQLETTLQQTPKDRVEDVEAVTQAADMLVNIASKKNPNKKMIQITSEGLKQAAQNVADIMPNVLTIATSIIMVVGKLTG